MQNALPTVIDLERLSIRAVVVYAARTAFRLSAELRGHIDEDIIDQLQAAIGSVCTTYFVGDLDGAALLRLNAKLLAAVGVTENPIQHSPFASSMRLASMAAYQVIDAANDPERLRLCLSRAVKWAEKAVSRVNALDDNARLVAIRAARQDYDTLVETYGEHADAVIGEPINCFPGFEV